MASAPTVPDPRVGHRLDISIDADGGVSTDGLSLPVDFTFGFIDITGFTSYCQNRGEYAAIALLARFRALTRSTALRRGVRVSKWLGDGVMLVGADQGAMVAMAGEMLIRCEAAGLDTHAGLARGPVLLFEGDDYVGRPVNLAARLCDAAGPREVLAAGLADPLPEWIEAGTMRPLDLTGLGSIHGVLTLQVQAEVAARFRGALSDH